MSLNLTRLVSIKNRPVRVVTLQERWHKIDCTEKYGPKGYIYLMSQSLLEMVVEAGDDIFLLDTDVTSPIYLILRKTDNPREFHLIAVCPHLAFFTKNFMFDRSWEALPLGDLQESLHTDLTDLRGFYDHEVSGPVYDDLQVTRKRLLFPGRRGQVTFKEVLPLLLGSARDEHKHKFKSQRGFQELYLESIDPKFQPRVSNGFCELSLDVEGKEDINNLVDCHAYGTENMKGWTTVRIREDAGRVVLKRSMRTIRQELRTMVCASIMRSDFDPLRLLDRLVDKLEDADVGERIMASPVEEDHFRGGTHSELDEVFRKFELDGSTFRVRIV